MRRRFFASIMCVVLVALLVTGCDSLSIPGSQSAAPAHFVSGVAQAGAASEIPADETMEAAEGPSGEPAASTGPSLLSPTTGRLGSTDTYRPIIVQIENEFDARPQAGLQWADVVYETMIEGVDTRFTCVFNDILYEEDSPQKLEVGPVRSSRYYHQWIQGEWDALYVHQGGAETAGRQSYIWGDSADHIKQRINGAGKYPSNAEMIYRRQGTGKALEHTAYTELHADEEIMNYDPVQYQRFLFAAEDEDLYGNEPLVDSVRLSYWTRPGFAEYRYDQDSNKLIRYMSGEPFIAEETGEPLEVQNLVIQYTNVSDFSGEGGRKQIDMFGSGDAEFIINGHHLTGYWSRKEGENTATVYTLDNGQEVMFTPGNTWIEVHPDDREVITTYEDGTEYSNL